MRPRSPSTRLTVFAAMSLLVLTALLSGCFGTIGVNVYRASPAGNATENKSRYFSLNAGRVLVVTQTNITTGGPAPGTTFRWERWRPRLPDLKRAIWEFDAHPLALPSGQLFLFAFPIWMIALPFLIAPALYLRRRRKSRREPAGFTVVQTASS